jgi:hypothetical protein
MIRCVNHVEEHAEVAESVGYGGHSDASRPAHGGGRFGLVAIGAALVLVLVTASLGTSAAEPPLPGSRLSPPFVLPWRASVESTAWLVTLTLAAATILGGVGVFLALRALSRGWLPRVRPLIVFGYLAAVAAVLVPPMGSADHLDYAAYGRIAATGGNPYVQTAHTLAAHGDPIGRAVEAPWLNTPSVYGPVGTAEQWFASVLGGTSTHTTVFVLSALGALAFLLTGAMLRRIAGDDPAARARVVIGFSLNPLLIFEVVNASHIDGFGLCFVVAALYALTRRRDLAHAIAAGVLVAAGCAVKLSFGIYVLALLWGLRRRPRLAAAFLGSAAVVGLAGYAVVGARALDNARQATSMISFAVPARLLLGALSPLLGGSTRGVIDLLAWLACAAVVFLLARHVRAGASRDASDVRVPATGHDGASDDRDDAVAAMVKAAALLAVAWLLTAVYSLPWYDVAAWAPLVLCRPGPVDGLLAARTTMLTLAYLPGRVVTLPHVLTIVADDTRARVAPWVGVLLLLSSFLLGRRGLAGRLGGGARRPGAVSSARPDISN